MKGRSLVITGAGGFLGRELCRQASECGYRIIGIDVEGVPRLSEVEWEVVTQERSLGDILRELSAEIVVHSAFRNRKPDGWGDSQYLADAVEIGTQVAEAVLAAGSRTVLVSSSAVYGGAGGDALITEESPRNPVSLYGLAKVLCEEVFEFRRQHDLDIKIVRLFNLIGPTPQPGMLTTDWVVQAAEVRAGRRKTVEVHHRRTSRDFVDVRDAARAILLVSLIPTASHCYNVAGGMAVPLMELSEALEIVAGIPLVFEETSAYVAAESDARYQRGSYDLLKRDYMWAPQITWQESLRELWEYVLSDQRT